MLLHNLVNTCTCEGFLKLTIPSMQIKELHFVQCHMASRLIAVSSLPVDSVLHLTDKQVKLGNSNRPFPHSTCTSVCLNHSTRTRVGWTFSYICCIFVHPDLESVYCFLKYGKGLLQNYNFITIRHEIWRGERMAYGPVYTSHMLTLHLLKNQVQRKNPCSQARGWGYSLTCLWAPLGMSIPKG